MPLLLLTIPLLLGLILLVLGLRGRRISTHPHCRKCKFDLHGLTAPAVCPECGSSLNQPLAVTQGLRRKSRVAISFGIILISCTVALGAVLGGAFSANRLTLMPIWLLFAEAKSGTPSADRAIQEIHRRITVKQIAPSAVAPIVVHALAQQADPAKTWNYRWGDVIESARIGGMVSDVDWATYARQTVTVIAEPRRTIRVGDPYCVHLAPEFRGAMQTVLRFNISWWIYWNSSDSNPIFVQWGDGLAGGGTTVFVRPTSVVSVRDIEGISRPTAIGTSTLEFAVGWVVTDSTLPAFDPALLTQPNETDRAAAEKLIAPQDLAEPLPPNTVAAWKQIVSEKINVVSRETEVIKLVRDPALKPRMHQAVQLLRIRKNTQYDSCSTSPTEQFHHVEVTIGSDSVPLVCRLIIEDPDHPPLPLLTLGIPRPTSSHSRCIPGPYPPQFARKRVTVRLVPDVDAAMEILGVTQIWGEEIVLDNVPVYDVATDYGSIWELPSTATVRR